MLLLGLSDAAEYSAGGGALSVALTMLMSSRQDLATAALPRPLAISRRE